VLASLIAPLGLSQPAGAQQLPQLTASDNITITFYNYNLASAGIGRDGTVQLLDEFKQKFPNITVEAVGVPAAEMTTRVQTDLVAGRAPDLAQLIFSELDFSVSNFGVQALNRIVPDSEWKAHIEGMAPNGVKLTNLRGNTYGLAYVFSTPILFYNADLFRAAGLDPDKPPRNWEEVANAALQIREKTKTAGFFAGVFGPYDWLYQAIVLSNGGRVLSEDRKTLMFGEPAAAEAIAMLRRMREDGGLVHMADNDAFDAMRSGRLGMMLHTSALHAFLASGAKDKFELRGAKMPSFGDKPAKPTNSGSGLFILSKDPKKQRAAWELVKFLTSERGYTIITSKIGYLPLRPAIVDDPRYLADWAKSNPMVRVNLGQLEVLNPWESIPGNNYRQIQKIETQAFEQAILGSGDVKGILAEAQQRAQALMPR
jgi:multiple sugar transport system substrate-binding protein